MSEKQPKRPVGRPPKAQARRIPDTFENILKAVVRPVKRPEGKK